MIIYGKQIIDLTLKNHPNKFIEFYLAKDIDKDLFKQYAKLNLPIKRVDFKMAQALAKGGNHQGVLAKITDIEPISFKEIKKENTLLVLCALSDVGNIGSIFRSSYALGIGGIIISQSNLSSNAIEGILRSSAGAMLDMPFCMFKNVYDLVNELKMEDFTLLGADMKGVEIKNENISKYALFLGSESVGINQKLLSKMDKIVSIKMHRQFDSLNVANACAILLDRLQN